MKHNFSEEEKECLRHALMHLEHNKILENLGYKYWYSGNRREFIARHKKALAVLRGFLGQAEDSAMNAQQKSFAEQFKQLVEKYGDVEDFFVYNENRIGCRYANLVLHREEDGWHCGKLPEAYPTPAECYGRLWEGVA